MLEPAQSCSHGRRYTESGYAQLLRSTTPFCGSLAENFESCAWIKSAASKSLVLPETPTKDHHLLPPSDRDFFVGVYLQSIMLEPDGPNHHGELIPVHLIAATDLPSPELFVSIGRQGTLLVPGKRETTLATHIYQRPLFLFAALHFNRHIYGQIQD